MAALELSPVIDLESATVGKWPSVARHHSMKINDSYLEM
jgi:hypothetical protein